MRNKIKQLMNKEEGFTLVELLAVVVILGIILAIAIPSIGGIVTRAQQDAYKAEDALIEDAARLYFVQHPEDTDGVSVDELITLKYLDLRDSELFEEESTSVNRVRNITNTDGIILVPKNNKITSDENL